MAGPIAAGALRVGASILRGARVFKRGINATVDVGTGTARSTVNKIKQTNAKIKTEKKKQYRFDREINERMRQRAKESGLEGKRITKASSNIIQKVLKKPIDALLKLLLAWVVDNLPRLTKMVENTSKRIRIFSSAVKATFSETGSIIKSLGKILIAYAKNLATLDFSDSKGRVSEAQAELTENIDDLRSSFSEMKNVWGREEEDLDRILTDLESGDGLADALNYVDKAFDSGDSVVEPQTRAVGPGSSTGGNYDGKNKWGMKTSTATNTKWSSVLDLIASAESVDGSYDSAYPSKIVPGLSGMTIQDALNKTGGTDPRTGKNYAIGRYQFTTLLRQAAVVGLKPTDQFSPENQDKMAIGLIEGKRELTIDKLKTNPYASQMALAQEWAGLAAPDTQKSYYDGDKVNASSRTSAEIQGVFQESVNAPPPQQASPNTQQPQATGSQTGADSRGMTLGDKLTSKDFNTTDRSVSSPIIKTSGFGPRGGRIHKGIDFAPPNGARGWYCGLNVNGKVSFVGTDSGYGNFVIIQVGNVDLLFGHLSQVSPGIRVGAKYTAGQPIGEVGSTGRSSGTHLHFEARPAGGGGGSGFNPEPYVKHLIFGKLKKKTKSDKVTLSGNSGAKSEELNKKANSNRTGAGSGNSDKVAVVVATQLVKT